MRCFASAAGGDKPRVFYGISRQFSLRDRRIKLSPPMPRKHPFHRIGLEKPLAKFFVRDFRNPSERYSNATFTVEYRPFVDSSAFDVTKRALDSFLPGCTIVRSPVQPTDASFKVTRERDQKVLMKISKLSGFKQSDNRQLVPIRQLDLFSQRNKIESDTVLSDAAKKERMALIDKQLAALN